LGFGTIYLHNTYTIQDGSERSTHRFTSYAKSYTERFSAVEVAAQVALLFNGNLITDSKLTSFQTWFTQ
jgi:hypothetical protein